MWFNMFAWYVEFKSKVEYVKVAFWNLSFTFHLCSSFHNIHICSMSIVICLLTWKFQMLSNVSKWQLENFQRNFEEGQKLNNVHRLVLKLTEKSCLVDNIWNWQDVQTNNSWTLVIWCRYCSRSIIKSIQLKVREVLCERFLPGCSIRSKRAAIQDLQNMRIIWSGKLRWWWWSRWPARTTGWQAEQGEQQKVGNLKKIFIE